MIIRWENDPDDPYADPDWLQEQAEFGKQFKTIAQFRGRLYVYPDFTLSNGYNKE